MDAPAETPKEKAFEPLGNNLAEVFFRDAGRQIKQENCRGHSSKKVTKQGPLRETEENFETLGEIFDKLVAEALHDIKASRS